MSTFCTIVVIGGFVVDGFKTGGYGAHHTFDFSPENLSTDELVSRVKADVPDAYAVMLPDRTLYYFDRQTVGVVDDKPWTMSQEKFDSAIAGGFPTLEQARKNYADYLERKSLNRHPESLHQPT